MATKVLWYVSLALCLVSVCRAAPAPAPGLLRVPKVYNAIINSDDNLTPSRAFPLIQPVLHETPLTYPVGPVLYHPTHHLPYDDRDPKQDATANIEQSERQNEATTESPKQDPEPPKRDGNKTPPQKPNAPSDPSIPLNENGLPPSLIPVQQYTPKLAYPYEPYSPYTPYYTDPYSGVILPYSNPYSPYYHPYSPNPFGPYLLQPPFYSVPPTYQRGPPPQSLQPGLPPQSIQQAQWGEQEQAPWQQTAVGDIKGHKPQREQLGPAPPPQGLEGNIKNNGNKNPNIPDVPPPPLPVSVPSSAKKSN